MLCYFLKDIHEVAFVNSRTHQRMRKLGVTKSLLVIRVWGRPRTHKYVEYSIRSKGGSNG
jgi:hypothetical protein